MDAKKQAGTSSTSAGSTSPAHQRAAEQPPAMIEALGLTKHYGPFVATEDVTFRVPKGQVAAFLGPNGAGKSTTMKLLTGFLAPTAGTARLGGFDVASHRLEAAAILGYLPENGPLYTEMTPLGLLRYVGHARGMSRELLSRRLDYVAETCALKSVWRKAIGKLSRGYRQRVGMAQALLHDPQILIMDEPTGGLDPNQVQGVRELIDRLRQEKTLLLSTHILREVHAMCDRVLLISKGRIVFDGPVAQMGSGDEEMENRFRELTAA